MTKGEKINLYKEARKTWEAEEAEKAYSLFKQINDCYPDEWEAEFFVKYLVLWNCSLDEVYDYGKELCDSEKSFLNMVDQGEKDKNKRQEAIELITDMLYNAFSLLIDIAYGEYEKTRKTEADKAKLVDKVVIANNILANQFNLLSKRYQSHFEQNKVWYFEEIVNSEVRIFPFKTKEERNAERTELQEKIDMIRKYKPSYNAKLPREKRWGIF